MAQYVKTPDLATQGTISQRGLALQFCNYYSHFCENGRGTPMV